MGWGGEVRKSGPRRFSEIRTGRQWQVWVSVYAELVIRVCTVLSLVSSSEVGA